MSNPATIADLQLDLRNARRRGPRASGLLESSLQEVGAARSIVIDEDNRILAGNGTVEAAGQVGIERVKVVEADGETIIAVRRRGLTEAQKKRLALLDNRTGELAEWDTEVLAGLVADGLEIGELWSENEFNLLLGKIEPPDDPRTLWEGIPGIGGEVKAAASLTVYFPTEADVEPFATLIGAAITGRTKYVWWPKEPD